MAELRVNLTPSSSVDNSVNETVQTEAEGLHTTQEATVNHSSTKDVAAKDVAASDVNLTGIRIDVRSGGPNMFGSSVFVFVIGKEKKIFAVHEGKLTADVLIDMCEARTRNQEEYRIELPDVDEYIFAAAVSYMYDYSLKEAVEYTSLMEGDALGSLYVFASKFKMDLFQFTILEELALPYKTPLILLQAAKIVCNELGADELFRLFFAEHIVGRLCSFQTGQHPDPDYHDVDVAEWATEGGLLGTDLTEAMLAALLNKKLCLVPTQQPTFVPPSHKFNLWGRGSVERPLVREATAIALRDWDGGNFSKLSFRKGDIIHGVESRYSRDARDNTWLWSAGSRYDREIFPAKYVRLHYPKLKDENDQWGRDGWGQDGGNTVSGKNDEFALGSENEDGSADASESIAEGRRECSADHNSKEAGLGGRFATW